MTKCSCFNSFWVFFITVLPSHRSYVRVPQFSPSPIYIYIYTKKRDPPCTSCYLILAAVETLLGTRSSLKPEKRSDRLSKSNDSHCKFSIHTFSFHWQNIHVNFSTKMTSEMTHSNSIKSMLYSSRRNLIKVKVNVFIKLPVKG